MYSNNAQPGAGTSGGYSTALVIETLRGWVLAGVNSLRWLELRVSSTPRYRSGASKTPVILPKVQAAGYTYTRTHPSPKEVGAGWLCCPGIVWETMWLTSSNATSLGTLGHSHARWATLDSFWPEKWSWCAWADLHLKKKKKHWHETKQNLPPKSSQVRGKSHYPQPSSIMMTDRLTDKSDSDRDYRS